MLAARRITLSGVMTALVLVWPAHAADLDRYFHEGTNQVISFNVQQFLDSVLIKKVGLDKLLAGQDSPQKLLKELDFDPLKDIERITLAGSESDDQVVLVIQGKFNQARFKAKAEDLVEMKQRFLKIHKADNGLIYEVTRLDELLPTPPQAKDALAPVKGKTLFVTMPDGKTLIASSSQALAGETLDKSAGKTKSRLKNKDFAGLIAAIDAKQTLSVAMTPSKSAGLEKVTRIIGGLTLGKDLVLAVRVGASDAEAAKDMADTIKEQSDAIQQVLTALSTQNQQWAPAIMTLTEILAAIKAEAKDKEIALKGTIKGETLEQLAKVLAQAAAKAAKEEKK